MHKHDWGIFENFANHYKVKSEDCLNSYSFNLISQVLVLYLISHFSIYLPPTPNYARLRSVSPTHCHKRIAFRAKAHTLYFLWQMCRLLLSLNSVALLLSLFPSPSSLFPLKICHQRQTKTNTFIFYIRFFIISFCRTTIAGIAFNTATSNDFILAFFASFWIFIIY